MGYLLLEFSYSLNPMYLFWQLNSIKETMGTIFKMLYKK
ncbi:unnamed protein product [Larinioides sclopetarius]|uniref:Uncharacterized protein n=1 Tax=Larinioides sclopetarius TaxID=280406 RepID=A0AAV2BMM0_9ARAC